MDWITDWFSPAVVCTDIGSFSVKISLPPHKTVIEVPAVVAVDERTEAVIAVGKKAQDLIGRAPESVKIHYPVVGGKLNDDTLFAKLLQSVINRHRRMYDEMFGYVWLVATNNDLSESDAELLKSVAGQIDVSSVRCVPESIAAFSGARETAHTTAASLMVNIGHQKTNIAVISGGSVVKSTSLATGAKAMEQAITEQVENSHSLVISELAARKLKESLVSFGDNSTEEMRVFGQDVSTHLPREEMVSGQGVIKAVSPMIENIAESSQNMLKNTSADLAADILQNGACVVGGAANIQGLADYFSEALTVPVHVSEAPELAVIRGLQHSAKNVASVKHINALSTQEHG